MLRKKSSHGQMLQLAKQGEGLEMRSISKRAHHFPIQRMGLLSAE